jgi:hypothetical protein
MKMTLGTSPLPSLTGMPSLIIIIIIPAIALHIAAFTNSSICRYLCIRRPDKGLLANQWEFPSVEVPPDSSETDITAACFSLLHDAFGIIIEASQCEIKPVNIYRAVRDMFSIQASSIKMHKDPIVHVFSHERHVSRVLDIEVNASLCASLQDDVQLFTPYASIGDTAPRQVTSGSMNYIVNCDAILHLCVWL